MQDQKHHKEIVIYTDGACIGNPGKGGWAAILFYKDLQKEIYGHKPHTTNNQMELMAVIEALKIIKTDSNTVKIYCDSLYVQDGITKWIFNWKKNNWQTANKKAVKNIELWQELDKQTKRQHINWFWVKGHSGNKYNEIVDKLAYNAAKNPPSETF